MITQIKVIGVLVGLLLPGLVFSYSTGPPNGRTGAPGEQTCNAAGCHNSFELNEGDGSLEFSNIPEEYQSGQTYTIELTIQDPGQSRWGFEVVALDADENQAGEMVITETDSTQAETDASTGRTYVKHTSQGTHNGVEDGPVSWTFDWTAPETDAGTVTFYVAGNAANGNNTNQGDYIYTNSQTVSVEATGTEVISGKIPSETALYPAYPNPFNPETVIEFSLARAGPAELIVTDLRGQVVNTLTSGQHTAGIHRVRWSGADQTGQMVPSGVYLYYLRTENKRFTRQMTLVR